MDFASSFSLLIGDNGTGKTTVLEALSAALSGWFCGLKAPYLRVPAIRDSNARLAAVAYGDEVRFERQLPPAFQAFLEMKRAARLGE